MTRARPTRTTTTSQEVCLLYTPTLPLQVHFGCVICSPLFAACDGTHRPVARVRAVVAGEGPANYELLDAPVKATHFCYAGPGANDSSLRSRYGKYGAQPWVPGCEIF